MKRALCVLLGCCLLSGIGLSQALIAALKDAGDNKFEYGGAPICTFSAVGHPSLKGEDLGDNKMVYFLSDDITVMTMKVAFDPDEPAEDKYFRVPAQGPITFNSQGFFNVPPIFGNNGQKSPVFIFLRHPKDASIKRSLYVDQVSGTLVYVGYDEQKDVGANNINFIPAVALPLPVPPAYPARGNITPIKCCGGGVRREDNMITGAPNIWCSGGTQDPTLNAFAYQMLTNPNNMHVLKQGDCDFAGMQPPKSVSWWKNAKILTQVKNLKIPDDIAGITGLYEDTNPDKMNRKTVYVGYDEQTDVGGNSISFIPDVALPLPVPPAYPGWMGITPIKCYNVKSGYMFTGKLNRWCDGSNKAFLKNFSYYVTEDLNGNINLVQGDCDFTGMPKGESLTWWTGAAKVLIKKIKKPAGKLKEIIDSLNQDAKTLGLKFSGDSAMHLATFIINQKNGYKAWKSRVDPDKPMDLRDYGRVRKGEVTFVRFGSHSFREPQGPPPTPEGTNWWAFCIDEGELGFWRLAVQ